jgi:16S rRNA processing protein RimM
MAASGYVIVGRIKRTHGLRGEIVVEPLTDAPDEIFSSGRCVVVGNTEGDISSDADEPPTEFHVRSMRPFGKNILVFFDELSDRTQAERWNARYLLVSGAEIPEPAEGEVFLHELPGMRVVSAGGEVYGEVSHTYELPHGLMLEVAREGKPNALLPFRSEMVTDVNRETRVITVSVPEGLFDP